MGWDEGRGRTLSPLLKWIFALTEEYEIGTISIPAISTGIYRYPLKEATKIAFAITAAAEEKQNLSVLLVCVDEDTARVYEETYRSELA